MESREPILTYCSITGRNARAVIEWNLMTTWRQEVHVPTMPHWAMAFNDFVDVSPFSNPINYPNHGME